MSNRIDDDDDDSWDVAHNADPHENEDFLYSSSPNDFVIVNEALSKRVMKEAVSTDGEISRWNQVA